MSDESIQVELAGLPSGLKTLEVGTPRHASTLLPGVMLEVYSYRTRPCARATFWRNTTRKRQPPAVRPLRAAELHPNPTLTPTLTLHPYIDGELNLI